MLLQRKLCINRIWNPELRIVYINLLAWLILPLYKIYRFSSIKIGALFLKEILLTCENIVPMPWFSFIKGYQIKSYERWTFQDCQMCTKSHCFFTNFHYLLNSSLFCQSISDTSQSQVTANIRMSKECLTTGNYDTKKSPSSDDIQQMSS